MSLPAPTIIASSQPQNSLATARLVEVFSAIQGEGPIVGTRQIFVRFGGCDLRCSFCDSAQTWIAPETCEIEQTPGERDFVNHPNPVTIDQLQAWVDRQNQPGLHDSLSITGGEPLLQSEFLRQWLPQARSATSLPIYLETGGHRPDRLPPVLPYLDIVGMDLKLPSASGETHWSAHRDFLSLCHRAGLDVFVKVIASRATSTEDLLQAAALVAAIDRQILYVLQPASPLLTPNPASPEPLESPTPDQVLVWQRLLKQQVDRVRVIPQTHKAIGQR